jgi:hypothetical protein
VRIRPDRRQQRRPVRASAHFGQSWQSWHLRLG